MKLEIKKTYKINDEDDWLRVAPPMKIEHWKNGRSAKLLAQYATSKKFVSDINKFLKGLGVKIEASAIAEPEAITTLPNKGNGRNHDLLIDDNNFIIGIEAKVAELFGNDTIINEYLKGSENKKERIDSLLSVINKKLDDVQDCRYQLLTGYVGTILEAKNKKKDKCVFLIIVFTGNVHIEDNEKINVAKNETEYKTFYEMLGISDGEYKEYNIGGDTINCAIKKVSINVGRTENEFLLDK